jgi:hypothetical protein
MSDNQIWVGTVDTQAQRVSQTIAYNPRSGGITQEVWSGKREHILPLYTAYAASGWQVQLTTGKAVWEMSATLNQDIVIGEPDPVPQWEISGHQGQQNVLECTDRPIISDLNTKAKATIELMLKNPASDAIYAADADTDNIYNSMKTVYDLMATGVEGKQIWSPVVSRTITVNSQYVANWTTNAVGSVLTKPQVVGYYGVPYWVENLMPNSTNINTDTNGVTTMWGYLEQYPTYRNVGNNKVQISQQWVYNKWPNLLYDTY